MDRAARGTRSPLRAAPARAGVYSVYACHLPNNAAAGTDGWTVFLANDQTGSVDGRDDCRGPTGAMTLRHIPVGGGATGSWTFGAAVGWTFSAPPNTAIQALALDHTFSADGPSHLVWEVPDTALRESCPFAARGCANTATSVRFPDWRKTDFAGFEQICRAPTDVNCDGPGASANVTRAVVDLRDDSAPLPSSPPSGALVDGSRPMTGRAQATLALRDTGGGVASLTAEVDGRAVATAADDNAGRCRVPYSFRVPCKLAATVTVGVDTTQLADGPHRVRLIARDAAGNTAVQGPYDVSVRNTPVACAASTNGAITAGLPRRRTATQRRARATTVRGTAPAGAQLRLNSRVSRRGDGAKAVGATVTAGANGRYSLRVPKGPSRSLRVGWRRPGEPDFACSRSLSLKVRVRISLSGSPKSVPAALPRATFRGRLSGGYVPRRGKLVLLQGRQPGRSWRTFRAVRSNLKGRFSTRYRFSGARGLFRVRARVPVEAAYPFAAATSRVVRVRVR